jgi:hypothetical protein
MNRFEKPAATKTPKAKLVRLRDGFFVFRAPKRMRRITTELVKYLDAMDGVPQNVAAKKGNLFD